MRPEISPSGGLVLAGLALVVIAIILGPKTPLRSGVDSDVTAPAAPTASPTAETNPQPAPPPTAPPPTAAPSTAAPSTAAPSTAAPSTATQSPVAQLKPSSSPHTYSNVPFAFYAGWTPDDRSLSIASLTLWRDLGERSGYSCRIEIVTHTGPDRPPETASVWADCVVLNLSLYTSQ